MATECTADESAGDGGAAGCSPWQPNNKTNGIQISRLYMINLISAQRHHSLATLPALMMAYRRSVTGNDYNEGGADILVSFGQPKGGVIKLFYGVFSVNRASG
jgi:hypothetical protein